MTVLGSSGRPRPGWLPVCGGRCAYAMGLLGAAAAIAFEVEAFLRVGPRLAHWDMLLITGLLAFAYGLHLVGTLPRRFEHMLDRLEHRGVIVGPEIVSGALRRALAERAVAGARTVGVIAAVAMLAAFAWVLVREFSWSRALLAAPEVLGAYVAGNFLGRMSVYGQLGRLLTRHEIEVCVLPGHADGAAGLKPIGDFYFTQATIAAIPVLYLGVWLLLFPYWPGYLAWQGPYLMLLTVALPLEILAFVVPVWRFHTVMVRKKREFLTHADDLSVEIERIGAALVAGGEAAREPGIAAKVEAMRQRFLAIENMPTWPVDARTRRRFGVNNVVLFVPLVTKLFDVDSRLEQLIRLLLREPP